MKAGAFPFKRLDAAKAAKLAAAGMGFVVFSNLSLQFNSVGFYQVMKHLTVAAVVAIEAVVFRRVLPRPLWAPVACLCVGIAITGATDFQLNVTGTVCAVLNVVFTAFYQIWCGALQRSLGANPLQLQLYIAPMSAVGLLPFVPLLDDYRRSSPASIWAWTPTPGVVGLIALTGVLAFCVNVSIFWVIGRTSAVSCNVLMAAFGGAPTTSRRWCATRPAPSRPTGGGGGGCWRLRPA